MIDNSTRRINLWSGPRNVSSALMYSFAQRPDTRVYDEPLYGHYLKVSGADHPESQMIIEGMDNNGLRVIKEVILGPCEKPVVFFKQMAHHLPSVPWDFLQQTDNVILIRNPVEVLPSLSVQLKSPTLADTGYDVQVELLRTPTAEGHQVPVLDAMELLLNPAAVLSRLCELLDLPFTDAMLHWPPGPKEYDGVWAELWYHNLHESTGFIPYQAKTGAFPPRLSELLEETRPLYEELYSAAIKAPR